MKIKMVHSGNEDYVYIFSRSERFWIKDGVLVEICATTMHYAPCHADAENTPVLRTEEPCAPKVRQTSFLPPCTAHSFGCFQKNGGCIPGDRRSPLREDGKYYVFAWDLGENAHSTAGDVSLSCLRTRK